MPKGRNATVRELVKRIVKTEGPKGQAVAGLNKLHDTLTKEMEAAKDPDDRRRIYHDIQYLEGWQETPAALLADMQKRPHRRRGSAKPEMEAPGIDHQADGELQFPTWSTFR